MVLKFSWPANQSADFVIVQLDSILKYEALNTMESRSDGRKPT
jgi:hypothetical protein